MPASRSRIRWAKVSSYAMWSSIPERPASHAPAAHIFHESGSIRPFSSSRLCHPAFLAPLPPQSYPIIAGSHSDSAGT